MKFKSGTILLFVIVLIASCTKNETLTIVEKDGVKHYRNRNTPANPLLKLVVDNKIVIEGNTGDSLVSFTSSSDMEIDDDGNFYIFDPRLQKIFKYSPEGKFIISFSGRGTGPGPRRPGRADQRRPAIGAP